MQTVIMSRHRLDTRWPCSPTTVCDYRHLGIDCQYLVQTPSQAKQLPYEHVHLFDNHTESISTNRSYDCHLLVCTLIVPNAELRILDGHLTILILPVIRIQKRGTGPQNACQIRR